MHVLYHLCTILLYWNHYCFSEVDSDSRVNEREDFLTLTSFGWLVMRVWFLVAVMWRL